MPGPRCIQPSAGAWEGRRSVRSAVREEPRHEALPLGDPLDLDRHRFDRALDALEPLVVCRWWKLPNRLRGDEALYEGTPEREADADGEDGDDPGLDEVEQIVVVHGGFG